jgi:hypothetical protein
MTVQLATAGDVVMERTRTVRIGAIVCLASIAGLASAWGVEDARFEVESS